MLRKKSKIFLTIASLLILMTACFEITSLTQPNSAQAGEQILTQLEVKMVQSDDNTHYGIVGLMLPVSWTVDSVYFSGDVGPDYCTFLPPDSIDGDPGGQVDYWTDSLEARYPSPANMEWRVYQSSQAWNKPSSTDAEDWYADLYIKMTVGNEDGDFSLSYFVTNAALDFSDSTWYAISQNNNITITGATGVSDAGILVKNYDLMQNYPNPFNPTTSISFSIPESGNVKLSVFNSLGEEVTTLVNGFLPAGFKTVKFDAQNFQSGVYYYRLESSGFVETKKMVLLK